MGTEYIVQRGWELYNYAKALREEANTDALRGKELLREMSEATDEEVKLNILKAFKKNQFFNNLKLSEMEATLKVLVEVISICKVMGLETNMTEDLENLYEVGKKRFIPMYALKGDKLEFLNKEMEEVIDKELDTPSDSDLEAVRNILKANKRWQRESN